MPTYLLFGRRVSVEPSLKTLVAPQSEGSIDLVVERVPAVERGSGRRAEAFFESGSLEEGAERWLTAFREGDHHLLRFVEGIEFRVERGRIAYSIGQKGDCASAETYLLGIVLALWLEISGALCLHASAVDTPLGGVGFLGFNRAGKSSLAASFLPEGFSLLTDDVLAVEVDSLGAIVATPSFPQLRLWPRSMDDLVENPTELEPVHPDFDKRRVPVGGAGLGTFQDSARPLDALFLPVREGSTIEMERLSPREAMIELVRHSFLGALGEAAIGIGRRFERLAWVAERIPVFHLRYPNGLEHLPRVRAAVLGHLEGL